MDGESCRLRLVAILVAATSVLADHIEVRGARAGLFNGGFDLSFQIRVELTYFLNDR